MQYTPLAIATIVEEALGYSVGIWALDRESVLRLGAHFANEIVLTGRALNARDASSWNSVFLKVERKLNRLLELQGRLGSPADYACRVVLDSCRSFVGLERRCEPKEV